MAGMLASQGASFAGERACLLGASASASHSGAARAGCASGRGAARGPVCGVFDNFGKSSNEKKDAEFARQQARGAARRARRYCVRCSCERRGARACSPRAPRPATARCARGCNHVLCLRAARLHAAACAQRAGADADTPTHACFLPRAAAARRRFSRRAAAARRT
jgi:hypothetical protein